MALIFDHVWFWHSRIGERDRKGLRCRVLVRGRRNSILVELEDGERVVTSRYAVRRVTVLLESSQPTFPELFLIQTLDRKKFPR